MKHRLILALVGSLFLTVAPGRADVARIPTPPLKKIALTGILSFEPQKSVLYSQVSTEKFLQLTPDRGSKVKTILVMDDHNRKACNEWTAELKKYIGKQIDLTVIGREFAQETNYTTVVLKRVDIRKLIALNEVGKPTR